MIYVVATLKAKPGKRDALIAGAKPCIAETRKEKGCVSYELFQSTSDPDTFNFVERWETREHLTAHFDTPHLKAWRAVGAECVASRAVEIIHADKVEKL